jgi:hypothetical protein
MLKKIIQGNHHHVVLVISFGGFFITNSISLIVIGVLGYLLNIR